MTLALTAEDLPDVRDHELISVDLETRDPNLKSKGPGDIRGDGRIAGIGVAVENGPAVYVPIGHETGPNLDREPVRRWLESELERRTQPIVGANFNYDRAWLYGDLGINLIGVPNHDTQVLEPLIDETKSSYSLETTSIDYGIEGGKADEALYARLASEFGGKPTRAGQGGNIWRAGSDWPELHDYVLSDIRNPLTIVRQQYALIDEYGLWDALGVEVTISDIVLAMRLRGVRVDTERAEYEKQRIGESVDGFLNEYGLSSLWAPSELEETVNRFGLEPPRTPKTDQVSITQSWLKSIAESDGDDGRFARGLLDARKADHVVNTFIDSYVLGNVCDDGRVHGQFHHLRGDDGGTITGRFSSSNPNLQNLVAPKRDPEYGPIVRGLFQPDVGEEWIAHDYAQIEPRLTLHYARGKEADRMRAAYANDPSIDCYDTLLEALTTEAISRPETKNIWLGLLYGMGKAKLCAELGVDRVRGEELIGVFDEAAPYVKRLKKDVENAAKRRGWLRTIGGRRANFPFYEPADFNLKFDDRFPLSRDRAAVAAALRDAGCPPRVVRAFAHKSLNKLIQGGAADVMKRAMVSCWEGGVVETLGPPLVTAHDELGWSRPRTNEGEEAAAEARRLMANPKGIELSIPLLVDEERGEDWGHVK